MATNQRYVSTQADIKVQRSRMPMNRRTIMTYLHGYLNPVGSPIEILPGDTIKAKLSCFTRMSTPIVPIMDNIRQEVDAFFIPKRILWNKTKQFYGEAPSFGVASPVVEPYSQIMCTQISSMTNNPINASESFAGAFGLVYDDATGSLAPNINILPLRAFLSVYNEYFRDENYQDPYTWDKDATGLTGTFARCGNSTISALDILPRVNKDRDVVTSLLPYNQKTTSPVAINLAGVAPVGVVESNTFKQLRLYTEPQYNGTIGAWSISKGGQDIVGLQTTDHEGGNLVNNSFFINESTNANLVANLASTTSVAIADLIYALAYQDFLTRCARFGTRYREYIYSMFGTRIADATEDIPEYLGRLKFRINISQVEQTTGFDASASTKLGSLGAYSNSGNSGTLFTKSFTEPGYLVLVSYCKHQRTYSSGIDRVFLKTELLDYYQPPFANILDVPYGSHNIWLDKAQETSLGFQEPFYDNRALMDRAYGFANPKIDSFGRIWTLADYYTAKPTIGSNFMKEDRNAIARCLVTGTNGPDYLQDFWLELDATRVMPLYSSGKLGTL